MGVVRVRTVPLHATRPGFVRMYASKRPPAPARNPPPRTGDNRESALRRFFEEKGLLRAHTPDERDPPSSAENPAPAAMRRSRLSAAKAKALAEASKPLREQVASAAPARSDAREARRTAKSAVRERAAVDAAPRPLSATRVPSTELPEVAAVATALSYNLEALRRSGRLPETWRWLEDNEVIYIPTWPVATQPEGDAHMLDSGSVLVFRAGCYVTWGMSPERSRAFYEEVLCAGGVECGAYSVAGDEAMEYVYLPDEVTRVVGDLIVVGQPPEGTERALQRFPRDIGASPDSVLSFALQARLAFSQGLAASARLSVQEAMLADYLRSVSQLPQRLEADGKVPLGRREVIRKLGTLLLLRQRLNLDHDNFVDDPELYWENSRMETLYRNTCSALDIQPRFGTLNGKLDHCENLLGVMRALLTEQSSHRMELIIIYLIAFEAGMTLVSHEYVPTPVAMWQSLTGLLASMA
ncbi:hypothetical protein MSPP1_001066 [Malassezia sp. CBS 17886]|nr:hypothetical protein MSPP1_001066 [Malassezia sp. CBS 17886]